ncbi:MAG: DNA translocase FtsK 4TM domain-containing protein [Bdellovibrionales bacterium]|nr:DNA translocase FtsK 4TM domain-containing protein [Bdellovibrionales bacterium]
MSHIFIKHRSDIRGILGLAIGAFVGFSLYSHSGLDPSFSFLSRSGVIHNFCGYIGALTADFLFQIFGVSAWLICLGLIHDSWDSFFHSKEPKTFRFRFILGGLIISATGGLLELYLPHYFSMGGLYRSGGFLGWLVCLPLVPLLSFMGTGILLFSFAIICLLFYSEKTMWELFQVRHRLFWSAQLLWQKMTKLFSTTQFFKNKFWPHNIKKRVLSISNEGISNGKKHFFPMNERLSSVPKATLAPEIKQNKLIPIQTMPSMEVKKSIRGSHSLSVSKEVATNWTLPKLSLLEDPPQKRLRWDEKEIKNKAKLLVEKLAQFSVHGEVVNIKPGPAVTLFEFKPAADVKISRITDLADDLSLALSSESVRIIAPIPGRDVVGIETSNSQRESVYLKDILNHGDFWENECRLPLTLGRRADGEPKVVDLRKMPHLLVAGTTGSGKSVFVVSIITGLLFRHSPQTLRLILVDPKQVDLAVFEKIPHLITPPVREAQQAVGVLRWAIREMEKRYRSMAKFGARGLESFNEIVGGLSAEEKQNHEDKNVFLEKEALLESYYFSFLPYIVIVVEEFGDLMAVDKVNVEQSVVRLAQMARACGIHLILAMQSPRRDVVTGLIKTNIPGRISFKVASKMDSRIILDESGAERLLARGDMLFLAPGVAKPDRHHGPYLAESEMNQVVKFWKDQGEPNYEASALRALQNKNGEKNFFEEDGSTDFSSDEDIKDEKYDEVLQHVATLKEVSASLLQRKFRLGYPRAARMIEIFEAEGVVGPANGSKPRTVLISTLPQEL